MTRYVVGLMAAIVAVVVLSSTLTRGEEAKSEGWIESYPKALELAKANKQIVLADFTGSDWCGFCIKLKKEVLDTQEFKDYAKDKLVLLELDYPSKKAQSEEIKKQNAELKAKFGVRGFPTVVFLDGEGKELGRVVGFGGKDGWWKQVKTILEKK